MINWVWIWRRLHCIGKMQQSDCKERRAEQRIDVGYCLDRYSIEDDHGNVTVSRP